MAGTGGAERAEAAPSERGNKVRKGGMGWEIK